MPSMIGEDTPSFLWNTTVLLCVKTMRTGQAVLQALSKGLGDGLHQDRDAFETTKASQAVRLSQGSAPKEIWRYQ